MRNLIRTMLVFILCLAFPQAALAQEVSAGLSDSCSFCGFCPEPFGICLFFYVIAFLVILFFLILLRKNVRKCPLCKEKCDPKAQMCPKCGYDFDSGLQSTLTIRVADSPELMKLQEESRKQANEAAIPDKAEVTDSHDRNNNVTSKDELIQTKERLARLQSLNEVKRCSKCGAELMDGANFCGRCGGPPIEPTAPLPPVIETKRCSNCGAEIMDGANFCGQCGSLPIEPIAPLPPVIEVKRCSKCGAELIDDEARFCGECGNSL